MKWFYIIYLVVKNRYYPTSVQSLKESVRRSADREGMASKLGELIDKHGRENWIEPLVDELGPYVQLQIGDIANMLEVFAKLVSSSMYCGAVLISRVVSITGDHLPKPLAHCFSSPQCFLYRSLRT